MGQRENWIYRPEGRQRSGILREHRGHNERFESGLPVTSVAAGGWRDREDKRVSCFLVYSIDSPISKDMETLCRIWQTSLGHSACHRARACLYRCDDDSDDYAVNKLPFTVVGCITLQFIVHARLGTDVFHVATSWITAYFSLTMVTNVLCSGKPIPMWILFPTVRVI